MLKIIALALIFLCYRYLKNINRFTRNPYTLKAIVGSKGSGKSLLLADIANSYIGSIYSNMDIGYDLPEDYWNYEYPPDSLIIIDEIAVKHSNRDFKTMPRDAIEWYKMQRKRRLTVIVSSQTLDFDKKIKDLCDAIIVVRRWNFLCIATAYKSVIAMVKQQDGSEDLVNTIKRSGIYKIYDIPRTVRRTESIGYKTEQIITKEENKDA